MATVLRKTKFYDIIRIKEQRERDGNRCLCGESFVKGQKMVVLVSRDPKAENVYFCNLACLKKAEREARDQRRNGKGSMSVLSLLIKAVREA